AAGLASVKEHGGLALVQDPDDALFPDMPRHALELTEVDHCVPAAELGMLVAQLTREAGGRPWRGAGVDAGAIQLGVDETEMMKGNLPGEALDGPPSPFTCPECGGSLW